MARPIKHGLDYFPFDVDFFSDEKIVAISGEFGIKGEITAIKLLCAIYRNGYFIEWSEMLKFKLLKELPGVNANLLEDIIARLVKWGFFNKHLFDSEGVLTSKGIQRRYQAICAKMHRKNVIQLHWLLDDGSETEAQSKTGKGNKSKPQPKPIAPPPEPKPTYSVERHKPVYLDDFINTMLKDEIWGEAICSRYHLRIDELPKLIQNFKLYCASVGKIELRDEQDAKSYFCNLLSQGKLNDTAIINNTHNGDSRPEHLKRHIASDNYEERQRDVIEYVANNLGKK